MAVELSFDCFSLLLRLFRESICQVGLNNFPAIAENMINKKKKKIRKGIMKTQWKKMVEPCKSPENVI